VDYAETRAESSRAPSPPPRLNRREEEYLEAILILEERHGIARVKNIAEMLGVKPPTVVESLEKLARKGLVEYQRHRGVRLTPEGRRIALEIYRRHKLLKKFLMMLGVPEDVAERDACYIEHGISEKSLELIVKFIEFVERCPYTKPLFLRHFRYYVEKGVWPPECPHVDKRGDGEGREDLHCASAPCVQEVVEKREG